MDSGETSADVVDVDELARMAGISPDSVSKVHMMGGMFPVPLPPLLPSGEPHTSRATWRFSRPLAERWVQAWKAAHAAELAEREAASRALAEHHNERQVALGELLAGVTHWRGVPVIHPGSPSSGARPGRFIRVFLPNFVDPRVPMPRPRVVGYRGGDPATNDQLDRRGHQGNELGLPTRQALDDAIAAAGRLIGNPESDRLLRLIAEADGDLWREAAADVRAGLTRELVAALGTQAAAARLLGVTDGAVRSSLRRLERRPDAATAARSTTIARHAEGKEKRS